MRLTADGGELRRTLEDFRAERKVPMALILSTIVAAGEARFCYCCWRSEVAVVVLAGDHGEMRC